jgi:HEPN domain-containing protein
MKPPDKIRDEFVRGWLLKADEDLNAATSLITYGLTFLSTVCFHSQQAAEKYLKAFLTFHQVEFPKTHDIDELLDLIKSVNANLSESLRDVIILTNYGVDVRYPCDFLNVSADDARQAIRLAEKVRDAVLKLL